MTSVKGGEQLSSQKAPSVACARELGVCTKAQFSRLLAPNSSSFRWSIAITCTKHLYFIVVVHLKL